MKVIRNFINYLTKFYTPVYDNGHLYPAMIDRKQNISIIYKIEYVNIDGKIETFDFFIIENLTTKQIAKINTSDLLYRVTSSDFNLIKNILHLDTDFQMLRFYNPNKDNHTEDYYVDDSKFFFSRDEIAEIILNIIPELEKNIHQLKISSYTIMNEFLSKPRTSKGLKKEYGYIFEDTFEFESNTKYKRKILFLPLNVKFTLKPHPKIIEKEVIFDGRHHVKISANVEITYQGLLEISWKITDFYVIDNRSYKDELKVLNENNQALLISLNDSDLEKHLNDWEVLERKT